ncbi:MAG: hypothetical protein AAFV53_03490 [Myxococcota bacterium]
MLSHVLLWLGAAWADPPTSPPPPSWTVSYIAQGVRPGAKVGYDFPVLRRVKRRPNRREGKRAIRRDLAIEPSLSMWHHWGNHTPVTLSAQAIYRRSKPNGRQRELFIGQGLTYAINAGFTYRFDGDTLDRSLLAGRAMSATSFGFGFGRDLRKKPRSNLELTWHARPTVTIWSPYNSGGAPVLTLELGVRL